jgi:hypothetical protein
MSPIPRNIPIERLDAAKQSFDGSELASSGTRNRLICRELNTDVVANHKAAEVRKRRVTQECR